MKRTGVVFLVLAIIGVMALAIRTHTPPIAKIQADAADARAAKAPTLLEQKALTEGQQARILSGFSPGVRKLDHRVVREQQAYQAEYARYLGLRERFTRAIAEAHGKNHSELEAMSAELDTALLGLKKRSESIAQRTGELNQAILAEYQAKQSH
jgi:hypothetical protein